MTTQLLSFTVFFFLCLPGESCGGKGGARSVHERSDGVMGVCVCAYVCVWNKYFSSFLHTSCELFYAERKAGEDDQRFIFMF